MNRLVGQERHTRHHRDHSEDVRGHHTVTGLSLQMSQRSKNHHYVPQALQKQFCVEGNSLWYSKRGDDGKFQAPCLRNIKTAFKRRNYYTQYDDGEPSDLAEREFYGDLDNKFATLILPYLEQIANGNPTAFSEDELVQVRLIVYDMMRRSPDLHANFFDEKKIGRDLQDKSKLIISDREGFEEEQTNGKLNENERLYEQNGRTIRVMATTHPPSKFMNDVLNEFSVRFVTTPRNKSFILTSRMVFMVDNGGEQMLVNPEIELWMPVSPKVGLILVRDYEDKVPQPYELNRDFVRRMNEFLADGSNEIASHNQKLIESITGKKAH